jgi:hypothetical protein
VNRSWRAALRRRVVRECGEPSEQFVRYGHTFGDWIDAVPGHRGPAEVEAGVAGYLGAAARVGRRWGTAAGAVLGAGVAVGCFLLVRLVA